MVVVKVLGITREMALETQVVMELVPEEAVGLEMGMAICIAA